MCFQSSSRFVKGIVVVIWTIVQTSFHIIFVLGGYYICQFKPSHYLIVIFYITYFYNHDKCGDVSIGGETFFCVKRDKNSTRLIDLESNATEEEDNVYDIVHTILEKAILPKESNHYRRTELYVFCSVAYDGCWLICTFLLFVGICFQVKKGLSICFYGPWLLATAVSVLLDVVAAVHFGLDILKIYNYTSWLKFIGVENYQAFAKFNKYKSSSYVPLISSVTMSVFWSRLFVFWILSIVNFSTISTSFANAYRGVDEEAKQAQKPVGRSNSRIFNSTQNTSESRIRNWQMFYGTVATNSTRSSTSSNGPSINRTRQIDRHNSEPTRKVAGNSTTRYSLDSNTEFMSSTDSSPKHSTNYKRYQDVTEGVDTNHLYIRDSDDESDKQQKPWSYLGFTDRPPRVLQQGYKATTRTRHASLEDNRTGSTVL